MVILELLTKYLNEWLRGILESGIRSNLSGLFDQVNEKVNEIAVTVGKSPSEWNESIYTMIKSLSDNVMVPIAGMVLAFVMTLELIQMIVERNNMADGDTFGIFKWVFKSAAAVMIVSNTWNIVMGVFDVGQYLVDKAAGVTIGSVGINSEIFLSGLSDKLAVLQTGELIGLWVQSFVIKMGMCFLQICILVVVFGRMIEIYMVTSVAPIPMATMMNKEAGQTGINYFRNLCALAVQGFLIMVCIAIYSALIQKVTVTDDITKSLWTAMGYTVLLCFALFKTGSLSKSLFSAH